MFSDNPDEPEFVFLPSTVLRVTGVYGLSPYGLLHSATIPNTIMGQNGVVGLLSGFMPPGPSATAADLAEYDLLYTLDEVENLQG